MIGNRREGTNWDESRKHALNTRYRICAFLSRFPACEMCDGRGIVDNAVIAHGESKMCFLLTATKAKCAYFSLVRFSQILAL